MVDTADLANLRWVDKTFYAAVGDAAVALRPNRNITPNQLYYLTRAFHRMTSLDLSDSESLNNISLGDLKSLAPCLRSLDLSRYDKKCEE